MSTIMIVVITFVATAAVACLVFFLLGKSKSSENIAQPELTPIHEEAEAKQAELKARYEALLQEANATCAELDKQLKSALSEAKPVAVNDQAEAVKNLQKKIKDLEDDLEEAEDDVADVKKKLRRKEDEMSELQGQYDKEVEVSADLRTALDNTKFELEQKTSELNLKMGSLDFVQEILSAPDASSEDIDQLSSSVDEVWSYMNRSFDVYNTLNGHVVFCNEDDFQKGMELKRSYWWDRYYDWAAVTMKSWLNGKTTIAFVGEFSAGKTSIVNRILSQDDPNVPLLPVSAKATTAIPTYIAGGPATTYRFVSPDGVVKSISQETFTEKVSKEVLGQIHGVQSLIKYFVMSYKNPHLEGLSILDTPGFNSNDKEDADRTMEVINECDALFWVFDVNAGTINRSSIENIKENLNKPLYVVINKVDTKASSEVDKVENLIRSTLDEAGIEVVQYIRFSSKAPIEDIMTPISNVAHLAERDTFLEDFKSDMECIFGIMQGRVNDYECTYNNAKEVEAQLEDQLEEQLNKIMDCCVGAVKVPRWETHFFSKDRYEMSPVEFKQMDGLLNEAYNEAQAVYVSTDDKKSTMDELRDAYRNSQQCYSNLCDVRALKNSVDNLLPGFEEIINQFK